MFDPRLNRIRKSNSKPKPNPDSSQSFLSTKKALQKFSLSFYGQDTMKKTKQIILDDCQLYDLPEVNSIRQRITQDKKRHKENMKGKTPNKDTTLKIDALFMDDIKLDQFQFVTTNASQLDHRQRPEIKKKVSRSNSVKVKDNQRNRKEIVMMDVYSARCKTAKCVSRKGKGPEKKLKKK